MSTNFATGKSLPMFATVTCGCVHRPDVTDRFGDEFDSVRGPGDLHDDC
jgi:hypothetical protein